MAGDWLILRPAPLHFPLIPFNELMPEIQGKRRYIIGLPSSNIFLGFPVISVQVKSLSRQAENLIGLEFASALPSFLPYFSLALHSCPFSGCRSNCAGEGQRRRRGGGRRRRRWREEGRLHDVLGNFTHIMFLPHARCNWKQQ